MRTFAQYVAEQEKSFVVQTITSFGITRNKHGGNRSKINGLPSVKPAKPAKYYDGIHVVGPIYDAKPRKSNILGQK